MSVLQLAIGLSFSAFEAHRNGLVVAFAYIFCVTYSIGEGPVPLVRGQQCNGWCQKTELIYQVYASECLPLEVRDTGTISKPRPSRYRADWR